MAIPKLKAFDCLNHDPIDQWVPEPDETIHYSLCLHIGPDDEEGADLFYVNIQTSPAPNEPNPGKSPAHRRIVVNPYSWEGVLEEIKSILERCDGDGWRRQSELLAKHFEWEFENYQASTS